MNDHKSESQPIAEHSAEFLGGRPSGPVQAVSVTAGYSSSPLAIPPILDDYRKAIRSHHSEKMPPEGVDLIRSGFALTSLLLAVVAFAGSWISTWALLPAVMALVTGPPGIVSRRRLLAIFAIGLGLATLVLILVRKAIFVFP